MNDENFDKLMSDKLREERDFPFKETQWLRAESRLNTSSPTGGWRWFWRSLPLLLLGGGLIYFGYLLQKNAEKIADLSRQVADLKQPNVEQNEQNLKPSAVETSPVLQRDTVVKTVVVRRFDTVFQTLVIRQTVDNQLNSDISEKKTPLSTNAQILKNESLKNDKNNLFENKKEEKTTIGNDVLAKEKNNLLDKKPSENGALNKANLTSEKPNLATADNLEKGNLKNEKPNLATAENLKNDGLKNEKPNLATAESLKKDSLKIEKNLLATAEKLENDSLNLRKKITENVTLTDSLKNAPLSTKSASGVINAENQAKSSENVNETQRKIIPTIKLGSFDIGISGGLAFVDSRDARRQNGYSFGLRLGKNIGKNWQLTSEIQQRNLHFETVHDDHRLGVPKAEPPTPDDDLESTKATTSFGNIAVGAKYLFGKNVRFQPYLGGQIVGEWRNEEFYDFQFLNRQTNVTTPKRVQFDDKVFNISILRAAAGVDFRIFGKLHGQLEANYDFQIKDVPQFKPVWQVKMAVLFQL